MGRNFCKAFRRTATSSFIGEDESLNVVVMDGSGVRMGQPFIERVKAAAFPCRLLAVGTNAIATSAMLKAGAEAGATGENAILVACRTA